MKNLIVPIAGESSRFPNVRPKWMLTHPTSEFMVIKSILGLDLASFEKIYFVTLRRFEEEYAFKDGFERELEQLGILTKSKVVLLDVDKTESQPDTVRLGIESENIQGSTLIKDSDNYFTIDGLSESNQVCFFDLNKFDGLNARNKSYIEFDSNGHISNIVEKRIISPTFSVGGYGFESAQTFCDFYGSVYDGQSEIYMSNIIYQMILQGHKFVGTEVLNYEDWGTLEEWNRYKRRYKTMFIDLDGVLVENSSVHFPPGIGAGSPQPRNIKLLQELYSTGKVKVVITTSRPEVVRYKTIEELKRHSIPYDELVMGLYHCERVLINDFSKTNPYPTAKVVNIERDVDNLEEYFE